MQSADELLKKVAQGDKRAFERLYEALHQKVYFYLFRIVADKPLAEDILVETFTTVWKKAYTFQGRSKGSTWIFGIARNMAYGHLRGVRYHDCLDDHLQVAGEKNGYVEQMDRRKMLKKAMETVSVKHREILNLIFFQEMTCREAAEVLRIPEGTVKTRIFHAKKAVKKALHGMGIKKQDAI